MTISSNAQRLEELSQLESRYGCATGEALEFSERELRELEISPTTLHDWRQLYRDYLESGGTPEELSRHRRSRQAQFS